jgi:hypothetical protein
MAVGKAIGGSEKGIFFPSQSCLSTAGAVCPALLVLHEYLHMVSCKHMTNVSLLCTVLEGQCVFVTC